MGTRCLTIFKEEETEITVLYRQFDGYETGHGKELAEFLKGFEICNGFGKEKPKLANGIECLAAQTIAYFKKTVGGFYIYPTNSRDCGEEYIYYVSGKAGQEPNIEIEDCYDEKTVFDGSASDCLNWIDKL